MKHQDISIIFVPGIRAKPPPDLHSEQLCRCLEVGIIHAGGVSAEASVIAEAFNLVGWSHAFYGEHADIMLDMPGVERLLRGEDKEEDDLREAQSFSRRFVGILYALADRFPILGSQFSTRRMQSRVHEINRYFSNADGAATVARKQVAGAIKHAWANEQRVLLIGHSFGSVIAYDALWGLSSAGTIDKVDMFLTMGSPLTMSYIRQHLQGAKLRGNDRYPACIRRWVNLTAIGEVTSMDRRLSHCFAEMRVLGLLESIDDDLELVNQFHGPDGLNVHECYGYFASQKTGQILLDWYRAGNI
ncbi:MAG: hypothetical protein GY727_08440 [Gammaproteobacteria bacterium]|nr:hypothetical protein [Gammaproteobacteria bacterium]MCP4089066.1 hypothetical protein [Gammaproteobacteria bacterium]MCP4833010.1 hypothetical protein [Gammaproteobacteria bacterium]MCP4928618.1 hypothetical protein [Gammaproteobacteria bacterium]